MNLSERHRLASIVSIALFLSVTLQAYGFKPAYDPIGLRSGVSTRVRSPLSRTFLDGEPSVGSMTSIQSSTSNTVREAADELNTESDVQSSLFWRGVVLFICVVWSTNFAVLKEIYKAAPNIDPPLYAAIRFSLAAAVLLPRTADIFSTEKGKILSTFICQYVLT
jgi:hypothetical protein